MSGPCKNCGSAGSDPTATACPVCNHSFVKAVVLEGSSGAVITALSIDVGPALLARAIGADDAKCSSSPQFRLVRAEDASWSLVASQSARNLTFVNGACVPPEGVRLMAGDEVSLAGKAGRMKVRFERED